MKTVQIFILEGPYLMKYTATVNEITICEFEFNLKKYFLKKLKDVYYHIINPVQHLRTNFSLSMGLGVFNIQI